MVIRMPFYFLGYCSLVYSIKFLLSLSCSIYFAYFAVLLSLFFYICYRRMANKDFYDAMHSFIIISCCDGFTTLTQCDLHHLLTLNRVPAHNNSTKLLS